MAGSFQGGSTLSVHRAFFVHFGRSGGSRRRYQGRVEHLSSGRTAQFSSLETLLGFVTTVLGSAEPAAPRSAIDREQATTKPADAPPSGKRAGRTRAVGRPR